MFTVIKILKNLDKEIIWMGLYNSSGFLQFQNNYIDIDNVQKIFGKCEIVEIYDDTLPHIHFPKYQDFSYLLDNRKLNVNDVIYMYDGEFTIKTISDNIRKSGYCDYIQWVEIDNILYPNKTKIYYDTHNVLTFTVKEKEGEFIWEDYNYQQYNLRKKLRQSGIINFQN